MSEENKAIARRFWEEAWAGNLDVVDEIYATDFVFHSANTGDERGLEGVKRRITTYRTPFPDLQVIVEDQIAEGDKVVTRVTWRGTHQGEFMGIAPTGKQVEWSGVVIQRIAGGKIVERWGAVSVLGLQQQFGVVLH